MRRRLLVVLGLMAVTLSACDSESMTLTGGTQATFDSVTSTALCGQHRVTSNPWPAVTSLEVATSVRGGPSTNGVAFALLNYHGAGHYESTTIKESLFLDDGVSEASIANAQDHLNSLPGVHGITFVSKDDAEKAVANDPIYKNARAALDFNPLPAALVVDVDLSQRSSVLSDPVVQPIVASEDDASWIHDYHPPAGISFGVYTARSLPTSADDIRALKNADLVFDGGSVDVNADEKSGSLSVDLSKAGSATVDSHLSGTWHCGSGK